MTEGLKIRALVVDDDSDARLKIRHLLARHPEVEIIGDYTNGRDAIAAIEEHSPDLVFLDVVMSEFDGFDVLEQIEEELRPLVIFVTGYVEFAKPAFDVHAVDFLVKPLAQKRFDEALAQAKTWLSSKRESVATQHRSSSGYRKLLAFKSGGRVFFLPTDKIEWIKAEGKYVRLHFGGKSALLREPISVLEAQLDPDKFLLINRSNIVRIGCIKELQPLFNQKYKVVLSDGTELDLTDTGRKKLATRLGITL
jgi:two-component system LytT family response regulator